MKKDTTEMLRELEACDDFTAFYKQNSDNIIKKQLSEYLEELLIKHGMKKKDAIKNSEINDIYAYQIFAGSRIPERPKLLNLAIGMQLTLDEVQTLLRSSGYAPLYVKNEFDCIITYGICKRLKVTEVNSILYEHKLETLG